MDDPRPPSDTTPAAAAETAASELDELRAQLAEKQDQLLRALAEADNIRRRAQRDREDYVRYANESLLRDLVPVLDNLDRALAAARTDGSVCADAGPPTITSTRATGTINLFTFISLTPHSRAPFQRRALPRVAPPRRRRRSRRRLPRSVTELAEAARP